MIEIGTIDTLSIFLAYAYTVHTNGYCIHTILYSTPFCDVQFLETLDLFAVLERPQSLNIIFCFSPQKGCARQPKIGQSGEAVVTCGPRVRAGQPAAPAAVGEHGRRA